MKELLLASTVALGVGIHVLPAAAGVGWYRPLEPAYSIVQDVPTILQPQSDWEMTFDIQGSDGSVALLPSCGEPYVIDTVRTGILEGLNTQARSATGGIYRMFGKVELGTVRVHQTYSGGYVCDVHATPIMGSGSNDAAMQAMGLLAAEPYEFETFAKGGRIYVFFEDTNPDAQAGMAAN